MILVIPAPLELLIGWIRPGMDVAVPIWLEAGRSSTGGFEALGALLAGSGAERIEREVSAGGELAAVAPRELIVRMCPSS